MKFVITVDHQTKKGKVWETSDSKEYMLRFPNYVEPNADELIHRAKLRFEKETTKDKFLVVSYSLYADSVPTMSERSQIDLEGDIVNPAIELSEL